MSCCKECEHFHRVPDRKDATKKYNRLNFGECRLFPPNGYNSIENRASYNTIPEDTAMCSFFNKDFFK